MHSVHHPRVNGVTIVTPMSSPGLKDHHWESNRGRVRALRLAVAVAIAAAYCFAASSAFAAKAVEGSHSAANSPAKPDSSRDREPKAVDHAASQQANDHDKRGESPPAGKGEGDANRDKGHEDDKQEKHSKTTVEARCAGDTLYGELRTDSHTEDAFTLALSQERMKKGPWTPTGKAVVIRTHRGQQSYPFSFDVASYGAWAYAVAGASTEEIVRGASCAPGHQVPEAPNVLLLALSVFGVFGFSILRQRRHRS